MSILSLRTPNPPASQPEPKEVTVRDILVVVLVVVLVEAYGLLRKAS